MNSTHKWVRAADIAAQLGGSRTGASWRARCPAHGGTNPTSLSISEGDGATLLTCMAHGCSIEEICAALDIPLQSLFATHPDYRRSSARAERANGPGIRRLAASPTPASSEEIMLALLEEMLAGDPDFLEGCPEAQRTVAAAWKGGVAVQRLLAKYYPSPSAMLTKWAKHAAEDEEIDYPF